MFNPEKQFSNIYDQYIEKIYRFVYVKVNSQDIAEDITSKVFLKGWEVFQKEHDSIRNPGAFLYQIARNSVIDHYREKGKKGTISAEFIPEITDKSPGLQELAILSSDMDVVRLAIQNLKKDYQDIIIWHYLEDMKVPEIAQIMQKPEGTVRVMIHRGLNALKDELKGQIKQV